MSINRQGRSQRADDSECASAAAKPMLLLRVGLIPRIGDEVWRKTVPSHAFLPEEREAPLSSANQPVPWPDRLPASLSHTKCNAWRGIEKPTPHMIRAAAAAGSTFGAVFVNGKGTNMGSIFITIPTARGLHFAQQSISPTTTMVAAAAICHSPGRE